MRKQFLEAGKIINTHGIRGEVKIDPWTDAPEFFRKIKTLYIDDLCVDENARGKHVGSQLYEFVLKYAKNEGYYNVTLNVWADNLKALGFYEKLGLRKQKIGMEVIL